MSPGPVAALMITMNFLASAETSAAAKPFGDAT